MSFDRDKIYSDSSKLEYYYNLNGNFGYYLGELLSDRKESLKLKIKSVYQFIKP